MKGIVKWFSNIKGYGFLIPEDGGKDLFIHHSAILMDGYRTLAQGDRVEYETESGPGGRLQACKVKKIDSK
jgi:CspA family cold shock protein